MLYGYSHPYISIYNSKRWNVPSGYLTVCYGSHVPS